MEPDTSAVFAATELKDSHALNIFINKVICLFCLDEGRYPSINPDDTISMSLGILQWHGCRAGELLRRIIELDRQRARDLLSGTHLYEDAFRCEEFWYYRTAAPDEIAPLQELLASPPGRKAQNDLAFRDITTYICHGVALGITDSKALAYFCDLENQAGSLRAESIVRSMDVHTEKTLDNLCIASLVDELMGIRRRKRRLYVYSRVKAIFWDTA